MFEHHFLAAVDGRSLSNGSPGQKANGSCHLATCNGRKQTVRLELGTTTNHEAECLTLISALNDLAGPCCGPIRFSARTPGKQNMESLPPDARDVYRKDPQIALQRGWRTMIEGEKRGADHVGQGDLQEMPGIPL